MPRFDLASIVRRAKPNARRKAIVLRDVAPPATMATNLYRSTYARVIAAWSDALPRINAAYAQSLSELTQDSPADVRAEIDGAAEAINRLILILTPQVRDWALRTERWHRQKWIGAVLSATSVDLTTIVGPEDVRASLETTIEWNTALIKDVSAQTQQRIGNSVFDGLRNRTPSREVAKSISEATGMARTRSQRIASDQLNKLTSSLAEERRREAGIDTWKWRSSHKLNYRPEHAARDGKEYTDATAPKDRPGQLPYCGCRGQAVVKFD
ncbi:phage minor head protein [Sphingobium yanoikuyae]|uniref:phage minor head protein n=1 Tax=Sphingobium yanoikuyae TaxID=13690 RepID=UPI003B904371